MVQSPEFHPKMHLRSFRHSRPDKQPVGYGMGLGILRPPGRNGFLRAEHEHLAQIPVSRALATILSPDFRDILITPRRSRFAQAAAISATAPTENLGQKAAKNDRRNTLWPLACRHYRKLLFLVARRLVAHSHTTISRLHIFAFRIPGIRSGRRLLAGPLFVRLKTIAHQSSEREGACIARIGGIISFTILITGVMSLTRP